MFNKGKGTDVVKFFGASPAFLFRPLHANLLRVNKVHIHVSVIYRACKAHLLPGRRGTLYRTGCVLCLSENPPYGALYGGFFLSEDTLVVFELSVEDKANTHNEAGKNDYRSQ